MFLATPSKCQLLDRPFHAVVNSYWKFEAKDGGMYIECESISLTRDIPTGLGWLIKPFVTSIPKESLEMTMGSTRAALAAGKNENQKLETGN